MQRQAISLHSYFTVRKLIVVWNNLDILRLDLALKGNTDKNTSLREKKKPLCSRIMGCSLRVI